MSSTIKSWISALIQAFKLSAVTSVLVWTLGLVIGCPTGLEKLVDACTFGRIIVVACWAIGFGISILDWTNGFEIDAPCWTCWVVASYLNVVCVLGPAEKKIEGDIYAEAS